MSRTLHATLAAVALTSLAAGCDSASNDSPTDPPLSVEPAWSDGTTIWWGDRSLETGPIRSFSHTSDTVVWIDAGGTVWSSDGTEDPSRVGEAGLAGQIRADRWGSLAAWTEVPEEGPAAIAVRDTTGGDEVWRTTDGLRSDMRTERNAYSELSPWPPADTRPVAWIHAVDGDDIWWLGTGGTSVTDIADGETETVQTLAEGADEFAVLDVAGDTLLTYPFDARQPDPAGPVLAGDRPDEGVSLEAVLWQAGLSPDGDLALVAVGEGQEVRRTVDGRVEAIVPEGVTATTWLGATSFAGVDTRGAGRRVVVCELSDRCTPYADITSRGPLLWPDPPG